MAQAQKPDLVFQRNGRVHLNRRGRQFSRLLAVEECGSTGRPWIDHVPRHSARVVATLSNRLFPLHFPSHASSCAITFRTASTQVCGFKPGRNRRIFKGQKKILSTPFFGGEVKPSVPCRRFAACKRSLKCNVEVDILGKNYRLCFLPTQFHLSLLGVSRVARPRRRTGGESGNV